MCGLYTERTPAHLLRQRYDAAGDLFDWQPPERIARTDRAPVVRQNSEGERRLDILRFGLIPHWAEDAKIGAKMVNARGETVMEKAAFRTAFERRRCLVPAEGYFEWKDEDGRKQPYRITLGDGGPMTFAGLWARWRPPGAGDGEPVDSFAIITTTPAASIAQIHDRMPVILAAEHHARWLTAAPEELLVLIKPYDGALAAEPVTLPPPPRRAAPKPAKPAKESTPRLL